MSSASMPSDLQYTFGKRVREFRAALGVTQAKLAELLNTQQSTISEIEKGEHAPTLETVERIADALKTPASKFFEKSSPKRKNSA